MSSESSARQRIHTKNQALFSSKDKCKKLKCLLLQFLFGALRVKIKKNIFFKVSTRNFHEYTPCFSLPFLSKGDNFHGFLFGSQTIKPFLNVVLSEKNFLPLEWRQKQNGRLASPESKLLHYKGSHSEMQYCKFSESLFAQNLSFYMFIHLQ